MKRVCKNFTPKEMINSEPATPAGGQHVLPLKIEFKHMKKIVFVIFVLYLVSCDKNVKTSIDTFKTGTFKTTLEDSETTSMAFRNDTIQVETYDNKKDTFNIKWINQFEYVLVKRNPKTLLDSTPFHVKITAIKKNTYKFKAYYKGSNFKQKGSATKLK